MPNAVLLAAMLSLLAPPRDIDAEQAARLEQASAALLSGNAKGALEAIDPVISAYEAENATEKRRIYCGMSPAQTLAYMVQAGVAKKDAVAMSSRYCDSLFIKGYALVDLGRVADARVVYERLIVFAPMHAHFLSELGQTYRLERNWTRMAETCERAAGYADLAEPARIKAEKGLAWRCIGYARIEQGRYDEAEKLYRQCLALDPNDAKAKGELQFITEQRGKRT